MALAHPPTAVFAISDVLAAGVVRQLFQMGLRAGRDVDVIGFDNTSLSKVTTPSISTVAQPRTLLGGKAAELLLEKIADLHSPIRSVRVPHRLVLRETTREKI